MKAAQLTKYAGVGIVAGIAAYASYTHMRELALTHGQTPMVASLLPVSVDGMLIVATLVMREDRAAGLKVRVWAWIAFILGVAASVIANVLAAADDVTSRVISAWPAIALLLVIEVLATGKKAPAQTTGHQAQQEPDVPTAAPAVTSEIEPSDTSGQEPAKPVRKPSAARSQREASTADRVTAYAKRYPHKTAPEIAVKYGVSVRTVERYLKADADDTETAEQPPAMTTASQMTDLDRELQETRESVFAGQDA